MNAARLHSTHWTRQRGLRLLMGLSLMAGLMVARAGSVEAVHTTGVDNFFELGPATEGATTNIVDDGLSQPDWDEIFDGNGDATLPANGVAAKFIQDDLSTSSSTDDTVFAGSNKNNDTVESWNWASGNVPVKDDLANVYAYAAKNNGDLIIYAGLERLSPNGDSHIDIEFNQKEVTLDRLLVDPEAEACGNDQTAGPGDGAPCEFVTEEENNNRTNDDFIVSLDYTKGGALGSLEVRKFVDGSYVHVFTKQGEGCNEDELAPIEEDAICGFTNGDHIDGGDWDNFNSKGAVITTDLPKNAFAEFGINITEILGDELCFATFGVHTRSSASFTAELKDFAIGGFQVCHPDTTLRVSAEVNLTFYEENTGSAPLTNPFGDLDFVSDLDQEADHTCDEDSFDQVFQEGDASHNFGDVGVDGVGADNNMIDPGEIFRFKCTVTLNSEEETGLTEGASETIATGHGIFNGEDRTFCTDNTDKMPFESAMVNATTTASPSCDDDEQRIVTVTIADGIPDSD